jgi:hypothetical protein
MQRQKAEEETRRVAEEKRREAEAFAKLEELKKKKAEEDVSRPFFQPLTLDVYTRHHALCIYMNNNLNISFDW